MLGFIFVQKTLLLLCASAEKIMLKVREAGFHIAALKETHLTEEMVAGIYGDKQEKEYYQGLTEFMTRYFILYCRCI